AKGFRFVKTNLNPDFCLWENSKSHHEIQRKNCQPIVAISQRTEQAEHHNEQIQHSQIVLVNIKSFFLFLIKKPSQDTEQYHQSTLKTTHLCDLQGSISTEKLFESISKISTVFLSP